VSGFDDKDPPIVQQEWLGGVNVIDIGDIRVARGLSRRPYSACGHHQLVYDHNERRVWCKDCESNIEAFDAFEQLVSRFHDKASELKCREKAVEEAEAHSIIRIAAKRLDEIYRRKKMVPACPHCSGGLLPEDVEHIGTVSRSWELARRKRKAEQ